MTYIGIDFSINYPAVCICKDFKEFKWVACVNSKQTKKDYAMIEDFSSNPDITIRFIESKQKKTDHYYLTERNKLRNQLDVIEALINQVVYVTSGEEQLIIGIEGYSYGSGGNSLIDIVQSTGILKSHIFNRLAKRSVDNIFVFSPGELKNAIGEKGNCGKTEIFNMFISDPKMESVKDSALYKFIIKNKSDVFNGKIVKSPISDMIDSFLPILKFKQLMQ